MIEVEKIVIHIRAAAADELPTATEKAGALLGAWARSAAEAITAELASASIGGPALVEKYLQAYSGAAAGALVQALRECKAFGIAEWLRQQRPVVERTQLEFNESGRAVAMTKRRVHDGPEEAA